MNALKGICKNCLGCNKLEYTGFQGIYKCDSYRNAEGEHDNNKCLDVNYVTDNTFWKDMKYKDGDKK